MNVEDISQLDELGVMFLMFGVGLHFSLRDLWVVRRDQYDLAISTGEEHQVLDQLRNTVRDMGIAWRRLDADSPLADLTLAEANLRDHTGASVIAVIRAQQVLPNPKSGTHFQEGDLIGLLGDSTQIAAFDQLFPSRMHAVPNTEQRQDADGTCAALKQQAASE